VPGPGTSGRKRLPAAVDLTAMDITEVTVVHHAALVLAALWVAAASGWTHPALFLVGLLYIFAVSAHAPSTRPPESLSLSPSCLGPIASVPRCCRELDELVKLWLPFLHRYI
jgi:hypothetical protein